MNCSLAIRNFIFLLAAASFALGVTPHETLATLIEDEWQYRLRTSPEFATAIGDNRYNDRLSDNSPAAMANEAEHNRNLYSTRATAGTVPASKHFKKLRLPLATTEAELTELFHMVGESRHEIEATWRLIRSGAIVMSEIGNAELSAISELMFQYASRPMDFADATLVHLARREGLSTIFTVDYSDFETYRIEGRRKFRVVPVNRSH